MPYSCSMSAADTTRAAAALMVWTSDPVAEQRQAGRHDDRQDEDPGDRGEPRATRQPAAAGGPGRLQGSRLGTVGLRDRSREAAVPIGTIDARHGTP